MTIAEQMLNKGRAEERAAVLVRLLTLKFGDVEPRVRLIIAGATPDALAMYIDRVLAADSVDAVLA